MSAQTSEVWGGPAALAQAEKHAWQKLPALELITATTLFNLLTWMFAQGDLNQGLFCFCSFLF